MKVKARVRGIYATAISKILYDNGVELVDVSEQIAKRLGIDQRRGEPADVTVKTDESDPSKILILGFPESVKIVGDILTTNIPDVLVLKPKVGLYAAFKTRIIRKTERECIVESPIGEAVLVDEANCEPGREVNVTVVKAPVKPNERLVVSSRVRVVGKYAIVGRGSRVSFSGFIRNKSRITELLNISTQYVRKGYSIRWRSNADEASLESIMDELPQLIELLHEIEKKLNDAEPLRIVYTGEYMLFLELTYTAKQYLDKVRNYVLPTAPFHHALRTIENSYEGVVDLIDTFAKYIDKRNLEEWIREWVMKRLEYRKDLRLYHKSLHKKDLILGEGTLESIGIENGKLKLVVKRLVRGKGMYDGLNVAKEPGDVALTSVFEGKWYIVHNYFSSDQSSQKGLYVNINTPPEVLPNGSITYLDLGVDIIRNDKGCRLIDSEEFRKLLTDEIVTGDVVARVTEAIDEVLNIFCH
ncbi:MAG: hypothetical protein DRO14_01410 [Thermoprotei archaeon]|nr:MAG: hypothetical protein DRO14_01410 [Thermoprotei archaeon]